MDVAVRFISAVSVVGRFPALAGVDLEVAEGEIALVHGPNGAGKTTLLRACAGLVPIVSGNAQVLGHDVRRDRRAVRRATALVGHASGLYDDLTALDNVRFSARAVGRPAAAAGDALERVGVRGRLLDVPVARLSAGQRRRVTLAAALVRDARLWLLDEPHAGLDADGRNRLDALVREVARRGTTVLIASHEVDQVRAVATRTVAVAGGRVVYRLPTSTVTPAKSEVIGAA